MGGWLLFVASLALAAGQSGPEPPKPRVQAAIPDRPAPRAPRQAEPQSDRQAVELREREVLLNRRMSLLAARAERVERRLEGLREPGATREHTSVVPGGIEGLRARLEEERTRLADAQSRLNYERTELERQRLRPPP